MRQTIELAGGRLEVAPYTVIRPMADEVEEGLEGKEGEEQEVAQEVAQAVGMEVA